MAQSRLIFVPLLLSALLAPAFAADQSQGTNGASSGKQHVLPPVIPPLIILAPTEVRTDPTLARGCWTRLFPAADFKGGDDLTIAGPLELPALHTPVGVDWKHKTQSLIVGPKATVTVYEGTHFSDKQASFKPGSQVTDLRQEMKNVGSINSLKIVCSK